MAAVCKNIAAAEPGSRQGPQPKFSEPTKDDHQDEEAPLLPSSAAKLSVEEDSLTTAAGKVAWACFMGLAYISASSAMIMYNKYLMHAERFPFPAALSTIHMLTCLTLGSVFYRLAPGLFPSAPLVFGKEAGSSFPDAWLRVLQPFFPLGICGAVSLVGSNAAYRYATVPFLQVVKESHLIFVYSLMVGFGLETLRFGSCLVLCFVAASAALAVWAEVHFSAVGLGLQLLAGLAQSLQVVLSNRMMSQRDGVKVDPMTMVLCTAPTMLCALLPANFALWNPLIPVRLFALFPLVAGNAILAFGLQVISTATVRSLSATGHALASVLKDLAIVAAAAAVLHEHLSRLQLVGFAGTVAGIIAYSAMRLFPSHFGR